MWQVYFIANCMAIKSSLSNYVLKIIITFKIKVKVRKLYLLMSCQLMNIFNLSFILLFNILLYAGK